jgi:hypothetical protein
MFAAAAYGKAQPAFTHHLMGWRARRRPVTNISPRECLRAIDEGETAGD